VVRLGTPVRVAPADLPEVVALPARLVRQAALRARVALRAQRVARRA
jgi:hypothetical protein